MEKTVETETKWKEKAVVAVGSCEISQGSWKPNYKLEKVRRQAGKGLCKCAKKLRASQVQFYAMCRKSLYKSTENEEAGKAKNCASVHRNTRIFVQKYRKL